MQKILRVRNSLWAAICIWLAFARSQQLPAQVKIAVPKISSTNSLNIFNISLTRDSLLRILGRTNGISSGYSPVLQNVDQPKGAFVGRLQAATLLNATPNAAFTTDQCSAPPAPTPPPLPPVSILPTANPVPPVSCTQVQQETVCVGLLGRVQCEVNVCCLRPNAASRCAVVSVYSYTTTTTFGG
jgi:hypothetical protein